jgi:hypothetical protein
MLLEKILSNMNPTGNILELIWVFRDESHSANPLMYTDRPNVSPSTCTFCHGCIYDVSMLKRENTLCNYLTDFEELNFSSEESCIRVTPKELYSVSWHIKLLIPVLDRFARPRGRIRTTA